MSDKVQHLLAYACVAFCGAAGFAGRWYLAVLGCALVLLGIGIELLQGLVPGRVVSLGDVSANALGVIVGFVACATTGLVSRSYKLKPPEPEDRPV
jgi:VanZ family protein